MTTSYRGSVSTGPEFRSSNSVKCFYHPASPAPGIKKLVITPDTLRTWSLKTFKATIYFGVAGIIIIIAVPNPGFADPSSLAVRIPAYLGFSFVLVAMVTNIISLVTGSIAWIKGSRHCAWIIVSLLILLFPLLLYIYLNI